MAGVLFDCEAKRRIFVILMQQKALFLKIFFDRWLYVSDCKWL